MVESKQPQQKTSTILPQYHTTNGVLQIGLLLLRRYNNTTCFCWMEKKEVIGKKRGQDGIAYSHHDPDCLCVVGLSLGEDPQRENGVACSKKRDSSHTSSCFFVGGVSSRDAQGGRKSPKKLYLSTVGVCSPWTPRGVLF